MAAENPSSKGQAWFCTTGLPSDIVIEVDNMTFHLHKFPLMSKSKKLHQLITEKEQEKIVIMTTNSEYEDDDEVEEQHRIHISLSDFFPCDSETFESAVKFCYGVKIDLTAANVAPLRCAAEVLEMTDEYSENNLISKTDKFFSQSVLKSVKDSIRTLKSCEKLNPLAEDLGIVENCVDSIADRASSTDPALFGWPVNEGVSDSKVSNQILWNGIEIGSRNKISTTTTTNNNVKESWFEDLVHLNLQLFSRLIAAMKAKDLKPEIVETCLIHYAQRYIPGISRANRKQRSSSFTILTESEQRELMEMIIANLPVEKTSTRYSTSVKFLFGLLRTANILNASEDSRSALEKKTGSVLERATLDDLLIPSYSYLNETLYDVSCVERILGYFLDSFEDLLGEIDGDDDNGGGGERLRSMIKVGKLIDGYLSEIASDANLKPDKFYELALLLPDHARVFDDGLYRAIDVFLKAHPWITKEEREKITGMLDCQKLTLEACTHAAQNERLPLRSVVQVLFFEQLQLRQAIAGTLIHSDMLPLESARPSIRRRDHDGEGDDDNDVDIVVMAPHPQANNTWKEAVRDNQVLRIDMDSMRTRVHQLERECSTMKKVIEKIDRAEQPVEGNGWRGSLSHRFGCKFKTQVCDSQSAVANVRRGRQHSHQQ